MVSIDAFRKLALSFPKAVEQAHFEKSSFRVEKKIFATLNEKDCLVALKLTPVDQSVFVDISKGAVYPVPGKWGLSGYTYFQLNNVRKQLLIDALIISFCNVASKKLVEEFTNR